MIRIDVECLTGIPNPDRRNNWNKILLGQRVDDIRVDMRHLPHQTRIDYLRRLISILLIFDMEFFR